MQSKNNVENAEAQTRKFIYFPITGEDLQFINRVTAYAINKQFRRNPSRSTGKNATQKRYLYNSFKSELRSLLTSPEQATIHEVGKVLWCMTNYDRMILLNRRPALIKSCAELDIILRNYIQPDDALLLASSQIDLLYDPDDKTLYDNIQLITRALPLHERDSFSDFALNAMAKAALKYRDDQGDDDTAASTNAFCAGTLLAAMSAIAYLTNASRIFSASAFIGAAGCLYTSLYNLQNQRAPWYSIWARSSMHGERSEASPSHVLSGGSNPAQL